MATTPIGKLQVRVPDLADTKAILEQQVAAAKAQTAKVEWDTGLLMGKLGAGEAWDKATKKSWGRNEALQDLVANVAPQQLAELQAAWKEQQRLATVVSSFEGVCQMLAAGATRTDHALSRSGRGLQLEARLMMQQRVETVEKAITAAGPEVQNQLPLQQLELLKANLGEQIKALEKKGVGAVEPTLLPGDVATLKQAAGALARAIDRPELQAGLQAAGERAQDPARFLRLLGGLAMLADQASSAPDYATTGAGWHYPDTRIHYRQRKQRPEVLYVAEPRRLETQTGIAKLAEGIIAAEKPDSTLEKGLVTRFLSEIGVDGKQAEGWKANAVGITDALAHEVLLPLRALNETINAMEAKHRGQRPRFEKAVGDITQAVVEGRYREWRYQHDISQEQMKPLGAARQPAWMGANVSIEAKGSHGGQLKTREEDGLDLFWLTKIGGPSHGFDYGGHCLLPLLSNARTKAIVVEDSRWPDHPAGRAYLRLLSTPDGQPFLYLEPTQRDFTHRKVYPDTREQPVGYEFQQVLLEHALAKARLLGVPLSVDHNLEGEARRLGAKGHNQAEPRYFLAPSAGVLEASDTLTNRHDWPQFEGEVVHPTPRFWIEAEGK